MAENERPKPEAGFQPVLAREQRPHQSLRMKVANLEAVLHARPFRPFEMWVDAEAVLVRHPDQVFLAENKTTVIVDAGDRIHIFDVPHITQLVRLRRAADKAASKGR